MRRRKPTVCVDWDGTCVELAWPAMGDWLPGAIDALRLLAEDYTITVHSCRMAAVQPSGDPRRMEDIARQWGLIREKLDAADLQEVRIHPAGAGKPHAVMYVDDRAHRLATRRSRQSWMGVVEKLRLRAGAEV